VLPMITMIAAASKIAPMLMARSRMSSMAWNRWTHSVDQCN